MLGSNGTRKPHILVEVAFFLHGLLQNYLDLQMSLAYVVLISFIGSCCMYMCIAMHLSVSESLARLKLCQREKAQRVKPGYADG